MDEYKRAIVGFFDARSTYNRSKLHAGMAGRLVRLAAPLPAERVLDIATGTGFVSIPAARLVGKQGTVVAVDISGGMLEQAAEAIRLAGLDNIQLVRADAESLEFSPDSFDLVSCCNALSYMVDIPGTLRRWYMLLRPGGRLVFNCWKQDSYATGHLLRSIAAAHGVQLPPVGQDTGTPERCRSLLIAAGFQRMEIVVQPTSDFLSSDQLGEVLESALKNPLFGLSEKDINRINGMRDEYMVAAQSARTRKSFDTEMGAYYIMAFK